jgi:hypothetical protein
MLAGHCLRLAERIAATSASGASGGASPQTLFTSCIVILYDER